MGAVGGLRRVSQQHHRTPTFTPTFTPGRPLAMFRIPLLFGGVVMLLFAAWTLLQGPGEVQTGGQGASGQAITVTAVDASLDDRPEFDVYADIDPAGDVECRDAAGKREHTLASMPQGEVTLDGSVWFGAGIQVPTDVGEQVTCTVEGASQILLVHRTGTYRVLQAALFGVAGLGGLLLGLIGLAVARRQRRLAL